MNLSDWTPALVPALLALLALWGPGLVITWVLGLRRWRIVVFAPMASAGVIGIAGVLSPLVGISFGWKLVLITAIAIAVIAGIVNVSVRAWRRRNPHATTGPREKNIPAEPKLWPNFVGVAIALPFMVATYVTGIQNPKYPPQSWDASFHLSAVRWIMESGNGSSFDLNAVSTNLTEAQSSQGGFYPAGFHDLVVLTAQDNPIVATNAVVIVLAALIWPLAAASLSTIFAPTSRILSAVAALAAATYSAFPEHPSSYGVLWPTVYSYALVPTVVVALADWFGRTNQKPMAVRTTFIGLLGAAGIFFAHPTGIFVALIAIVMLSIDLIVRLVAKTLRLSRAQITIFVLMIVGLVAGFVVARRHPLFQGVGSWERERIWGFLYGSFSAVFEPQRFWMDGGLEYIEWTLGVLTLIGALVALLTPRMRWLLFTWGVACYLFIASVMIEVPFYSLVAPWYSDWVRVRAIVPMFGAPIAAIGAWFIYEQLVKLLKTANNTRARAGVGALTVVALVFGFNQFGYAGGVARLQENYEATGESGLNGLVTPEELEFIESLPQYVGEDEMIIGDPRTGLPLIYALTGLNVTYRHLDGWWDYDFWALGQHLNRVVQGESYACELLARHNVRYFYSDDIMYWPDNVVGKTYVGVDDTRYLARVFKPVASGGGATLYEITTCDGVVEQ